MNTTIEFFTIGISVRLSDRFNVTQNKINFVKNCPQWGWKPGPLDLQVSALPTELSQHSVASLNLHCLYKVMLYWSCSRNEQSPTCEVVHETNKAHFRNLLTNRFLPSSVGKALAWRSGGPGFNPQWGQFLTKFFFALPCVKICQIIWQKRLSWKTQMYWKACLFLPQVQTSDGIVKADL